MLQIKDVYKSYGTGDLVQKALDGVSLNLREHELVSILGPSGSGKSTLLNVIGGLDQYDSGDLIINGISTKKYTDRDWDSYRNHTIGFVFQSYNLIPHQTVLANVELALTISGVSRSQRKARAAKALEEVGLGNQLHKKPNQMSGGQMQRVAIARALVNNPSILLADEPTGALDSETSVQVMELLKEVSKDRLVVMVTHNPELAEAYSDRIVRVKDGHIIDDTDPFQVDETALSQPEHKNMGKSSMSFWEALTLSFNNLKTKMGRTLLTAFAGSIGIIGIALITALSAGFQDYIDKVQEDTLASYPLTIQSESADMSVLMGPAPGTSAADAENSGVVDEQDVLSKMFARIGSNDLSAFKAHLESHWDEIGPSLSDVQYGYGISPRIYTDDPEEMYQVHPATLLKKVTGTDALSAIMDMNAFHPILESTQLMDSQYKILQGRWPENYNELVFVLPGANQMPDYLAYTLGMKDTDGLQEMVDAAMKGEEFHSDLVPAQWTYDDLMNLRFRLVNTPDLYSYNSQYQVWEDMSQDAEYMKNLLENSEEMKVVGVVCSRSGDVASLYNGIGYHPSLIDHLMEEAAQSEIVQAQLQKPDVDVFSGKPFAEANAQEDLNFDNMISIDGNAITNAFGMDVNLDAVLQLLDQYLSDVSSTLTVDTSQAQKEFSGLFSDIAVRMLTGYADAHENGDGVTKVWLTDAESIVESGLQNPDTQAAIAALAQQYNMTADDFLGVYRPLLTDLVTSFVAEGLTIDGIPAPKESAAEAAALAMLAPDTAAPYSDIIPLSVVETTDSAAEETETPSEAETMATEESTEPIASPTENASSQVPAATAAPELTESTVPDAPSLMGTESTMPTMPEIPEPTIPEYRPEIQLEDMYAPLNRADISGIVSRYLETPVFAGTTAVMGQKMMEPEILANLSEKISGFGNLLMGYLGGSVRVDENMLASAFHFNLNEEELRRLFDAMSSQQKERTAETNLRQLGYADPDCPTSMSIYMQNFDAKEAFLAFLKDYNTSMEESGHEEMVIRYNDMTGMMMASVRTIINSISYVLIAFVAVSLIVSSIMIGIITYISVMERTKEIGVLRAMGASKRNISQVFNAETFIIGTLSGLIGVGLTLLLLIPGNHLMQSLMGTTEITSYLPLTSAVILISISMLLTVLGGLIPSRQAAKKDPVIALRSE